MKKTKDKKHDLIWAIMMMLMLIPLVDSLNGYLLKGGGSSTGIGTLYRLLFLVIILGYIVTDKVPKISIFVIAEMMVFLVVQFAVSDKSYLNDSIETTVKLFTPMLMICAFVKMKSRSSIDIQDFDNLMEKLSVLFPLTILIPYALHMGYSTYFGDVGYKAFYYATNEISFSVCVMIMFLWQKIRRQFSIKYLFFILLNAASCVLIGSKISIGIMALFVFSLVVESIFIVNKKKIGRSFGTLLFIVAACFFVINRFSAAITKVVDRWIYNQKIADSGISFLFSHRNVFLSNGFRAFFSKGLLTTLLGWGLGGKNNNGLVFVEMDFFDILFGTGIIGASLIVVTYIVLLNKLNIRSKIGWFFILIAFSLSFVGGHILFTGLGGMMLAILCMYSSLIKNANSAPVAYNEKRGRVIV